MRDNKKNWITKHSSGPLKRPLTQTLDRIEAIVRVLALLVLLLPGFCYGTAAEDTYFYGLRADGAIVELELKSDSEPWSERSSVYGTKSAGALAYCWSTLINEVPTRLSCTAKQGAKPTLVYNALPVPNRGMHPPKGSPYSGEYSVISKKARLGTGQKRGDGTVMVIYTCLQGCSQDVPSRMYEVVKYD